ncbi:MAG: hypothetical protein M1831_005557 [Alyxoria varia]|nr:MAG: hypothetical protein M1831_005557 [Alyxoria varia]
MPCFQGLAVSIHSQDRPLPEHAIQKHSRSSWISTYIPVPEPRVSSTTGQPEQAGFAVSITLLVPGQSVPYTKNPNDPHGEPQYVRNQIGETSMRGKFTGVVRPYTPCTSSPNETVAAYIHFDGRAKEEVATLLRRGEETWVNSRWVSVPEAEGGGLAEREFMFREVGLERWLNGLDLKGEQKDVDARIERRKKKLEKKHQKRPFIKNEDSDDEEKRPSKLSNGVLRYGDGTGSDEEMACSDSDSEDEIPAPEAAGQIKVSLYRVIASGEVKRGEYSPQYDAHDDSEMDKDGAGGADSSLDHTTSFAKPRALDPRSISTQTVTGLDTPDKPFATFTFFYRGKGQLQKMGILSSPKNDVKVTPKPSKSKQMDFASLGTLKTSGTTGFVSYRDPDKKASKPAGSPQESVKPSEPAKSKDDADSDADEEDDEKQKKINGLSKDTGVDDEKEGPSKKELSAEEAKSRGELAESMQKIQLKRQRPDEPPSPSPTLDLAAGGYGSNSDTRNSSPSTAVGEGIPRNPALPKSLDNPSTSIGSPLKKQRASIGGEERPIHHVPPMSSLASSAVSAQPSSNQQENGHSSSAAVQEDSTQSDRPDSAFDNNMQPNKSAESMKTQSGELTPPAELSGSVPNDPISKEIQEPRNQMQEEL